MITFADVSEFQTVDWPTYGPKYHAAIVRAHNGFRADYKWAANRDGSRKYCAWRGFYQYLPASVDPRVAARAFAATVGTMLPGEVAILDLEEGDGDQRPRQAAWLDELHAAVEWTYSGLYFARAHLGGSVDWIAAYQSTEPTDHHLLWQRSSSGTFAGIPGNVDTNQFDGSLADLEALTEGEVMTQDDLDAIAHAVWAYDYSNSQAISWLSHANTNAVAANQNTTGLPAALDAIQASLDALKAAVAALPTSATDSVSGDLTVTGTLTVAPK